MDASCFIGGSRKIVTVQTGLCIYCTDHTKEQILSPMGQGTHPARREAILIGWMHVTVRVSKLLRKVTVQTGLCTCCKVRENTFRPRRIRHFAKGKLKMCRIQLQCSQRLNQCQLVKVSQKREYFRKRKSDLQNRGASGI